MASRAPSSEGDGATDETANMLCENLKTLGFSDSTLRSAILHQKDQSLFRRVIHFLFTKLDKEQAQKRFAICWPISDCHSERHFRETVANWFSELKEQEDAAPFVAAFHPGMLLHLGKRACVELLAAFSVLVLQRCVQRMKGVDLAFSYKPDCNQVMPALMEYATRRQQSSVDALKETRRRLEEEDASLAADLTRREEDAKFKLKILHEKSPVKGSIDTEHVEQAAEKLSAQAAEVQSVLDTWTKLSSDIRQGLEGMKEGVFDGAEFSPEGELDLISLLCHLKEELQDAGSRLQNADFSAVEDAIPFLQLHLDNKKELLRKLRLAREKLERMREHINAFNAREEEERSQSPAVPLRDIVIEGIAFNLNAPVAGATVGQASGDTAECQEIADVSAPQGALGGAGDCTNI